MPTATAAMPEIDQAIRVMVKRRDQRLIDKIDMVGPDEPMPIVSATRARRLARILYAADLLDREHLQLLERLAILAVDASTDGITWNQREVQELTDVIQALTLTPDSMLEQPTEREQEEARAELGQAKAK
jgi:hypothetical protein